MGKNGDFDIGRSINAIYPPPRNGAATSGSGGEEPASFIAPLSTMGGGPTANDSTFPAASASKKNGVAAERKAVPIGYLWPPLSVNRFDWGCCQKKGWGIGYWSLDLLQKKEKNGTGNPLNKIHLTPDPRNEVPRSSSTDRSREELPRPILHLLGTLLRPIGFEAHPDIRSS